MSRLSFFLVPLFTSFLSLPALAAPVLTITDRSSDLGTGNPVYQAFDEAVTQIENTVNDGFLSESSRASFLGSMAAANASSANDGSIDYDSQFSKFSWGLGLQGGVNGSLSASTGNLGANSLPSVGIAVQPTLSLGFSGDYLGFKKGGLLDGSRLSLIVAGGGYSTSFNGVSLSMLNFGAFARYKLIPAVGWKAIARWSGIDVTTGLGYSKVSASYSAELNVSESIPVAAESVTVSYAAPYSLGVQATNFSIPLDFSTSVRLFYLFTLYGGVGMNFNFGTSSFTGGSTGAVTASYSGGDLGLGNLFSGTAKLNLDVEPKGSPTLLIQKYFVGTQLNVLFFKIFAQGTRLSNGTTSAALGLRFGF